MAEKRFQVAVANLGTISEVLLMTPLLEALRKSRADTRITCIVARSASVALDYSPFVNELIIWPDQRKGVRSNLRLARQIARKHFDVGIVLSPNAYLNAGFRLGRAKMRIGYTPSRQSWMLTHRIDKSALPKDLHRTQFYLAAAKPLGIPTTETVRLHYTVTPTERDEARSILQRCEIDPAKHTIVAVHPGTGNLRHEKRRWPAADFLEVVKHAANTRGCKVVLLGDDEERETASQLVAQPSPNVVDLTSRLSFRESAAVLAQSHVLVHNSSAPMFLACAVGVPVIAVFGHANANVWGPVAANDRVVRRELPCSPCEPEFACDQSSECLTGLAASQVIAGLDQRLDNLRLNQRAG